MAVSFNKRELEKKKQNKKLEKQKRKEDRKANAGTGSFEDMIAYVDEYGVITDTPPENSRKEEIDIETIEISTPKQEKVEEGAPRGIVDFFNPDKGFGFIKSVGRQDKYFFHVSNAPASIAEGNLVTYDLERGQKGINAVNIVFVDKND